MNLMKQTDTAGDTAMGKRSWLLHDVSERSVGNNIACMILILALAFICKAQSAQGRGFESLLIDEDLYYSTFLRSKIAGRFELNSFSIPLVMGHYWMWRAWDQLFGNSLESARFLSSALLLWSLLGGYLLLRELGMQRHSALFVCLVTLGMPYLALSHYVMTDVPFSAINLWFWWLICRSSRCQGELWSGTLAFVLAAYAGTIRQLEPFISLGGLFFLLFVGKPSWTRKLYFSSAALLSVLPMLWCAYSLAQDSYFYINHSDIQEYQGFSLFKAGFRTPGKMLLLIHQIEYSFFSVFGPLLVLLGLIKLSRRSFLTSSFLVPLALVLSPEVLYLYSRTKKVGITDALGEIIIGQLDVLDYGGPSLQCAEYSPAVVLLIVLGLLIFTLKCFGLAYLIEWFRLEARRNPFPLWCFLVASCLAVIGALGGSLQYGLVFCPRFLMPALVTALCLGGLLYCSNFKELTGIRLHVFSLFFLFSALCCVGNYRSSLALSEASWSARRSAAAQNGRNPKILVTPHWFAGHQISANLSTRFPDHFPEDWCQDGPETLLLMRIDPLTASNLMRKEAGMVVVQSWLPPKNSAYTAKRGPKQ